MTLSNILSTVRILNGIKTIMSPMAKDLEEMRYPLTEKENSFKHKNTPYKPFKPYELRRRNMIRR